MNDSTNKTWLQYEAGKDYKRRIGLYETVRQNERFYRGDQWHGVGAENLPKPVFNIVRRVADYLASTIGSGRDFAAVVLGCTHFSFFKDCFRELLGKDVDIIDGNVGTVKRLISVLGDKIDDCQNDVGSVRYLISGDEADEVKIALFESLAERYKSIVNI